MSGWWLDFYRRGESNFLYNWQILKVAGIQVIGRYIFLFSLPLKTVCLQIAQSMHYRFNLTLTLITKVSKYSLKIITQ